MNRRIILKTVLICMGIFMISISVGLFYLFHYYRLETGKECRVLVAAADIENGHIIEGNALAFKEISPSDVNGYMLSEVGKVDGKKALTDIRKGDYIRSYDLVAQEAWYQDEDKFIVLPVDVEDRLANSITKGSLIDIKVELANTKAVPETVLSRVAVDEVLDENGLSAGDSIGNRKGYIRLVLNAEQRNRIYIARELGRLRYELYCTPTQKAAPEDFQIPGEYLKPPDPNASNTAVNPPEADQQSMRENSVK